MDLRFMNYDLLIIRCMRLNLKFNQVMNIKNIKAVYFVGIGME